VRISDGAFRALVGILRPRLPRPGLSAEVHTASALRYMGGGSYVDMCIVFCVHSGKCLPPFRSATVSHAAMGVPNRGGVGGNGVQFERAAGGEGCSEQCHAARCVSSGLRGRLLSGRFGTPRVQHAALASALTIDAKSGLDRSMEGDPSSRRRFRRAVMTSVVAR